MDHDPSNPNCREDISSYTKFICHIDNSHLWIYYLTIIFCIIVSLFAFFLLIYKRCHDNSPLWSDHIFEPITGFLFWLTLHSSLRAAHLIIVALELIPNAKILRSFINFSGWTCGQFAIATYIVGIFKAIPKLTFHRPTANRIDKKCKPTQFIPAHQSVILIYWSFNITVGVMISIFSCLRGYYINIQNQQMYKISHGCLLIILGIANLACILCLFKYGRLLVVLAKESIRLLSDGKDDSLKNHQQTYKAYLKKLKIINFALMVIASWSSILCLLWVITLFITKNSFSFGILTFVTNIGSAIMMMVAIYGIMFGEIYPKFIGDTEITSLTTISNIRWSEESKSYSSNYSSNNSNYT